MSRMSGSEEEGLSALSGDQAELLRLLLRRESIQSETIKQCPRGEGRGPVRFPTSSAQHRLWFLDQMEGGSAGYYVPLAVRLRGNLNREALCETLNALVRRHETLRTTFANVDGNSTQEIASGGQCALEQVDLCDYPEAEREAHVRAHEIQETQQPFDLRHGPLIRGRLLRLRADEHVLLVTMHHIISDGWSMGVFVRELAALYGEYRDGRTDPLPALRIQYADYAQWQRERLQGELLETQLEFWLSRLRGAAPHLELPTDRPRPSVQSYRGDNVSLVLDSRLTSALRKFAQRHEATLFMALYAAWAILLSRLSGQEDVVIGTPVANRQGAELEGLIGFFANTLALRVDVQRNTRVTELMQQVKDITLGAYDHLDMPFERLVEVLHPQRSLSRHPIFQVMLVLNNSPKTDLHLPGLTVSPEAEVSEPSMFDLGLLLEERGEEIVGFLNYATDLFDRNTIERWIGCFKELLGSLTEGIDARIAELSILPKSERRQVLDVFNPPLKRHPGERLIHELFEEQAVRAPDALAVLGSAGSLTYGELDRRANILARHLRRQGVGPDLRVAICIERSVDMVVGLLGILKAGGAYVPLDPAYPAERLEYMLKDAAPRVVLTRERLRHRLAYSAAPVFLIEDLVQEGTLASERHSGVDVEVRPEDLAYVIYTSGSTGQPKGVMVEHRNVANLLYAHAQYCNLEASDRVLQFASFAFDASIEEIFTPLMVGATIVLRPEELLGPDETFLQFLRDQRVTVAELPTAFWHQWAQKGGPHVEVPSLRLAVVGGEKAERRHLENWRESVYGRRSGWLNTYGPTEATVYATALLLEERTALSAGDIPIGRPIANTKIYILDEENQPVPTGVAGEIHIGGAGVARGYLNRPELTAERFLTDPFSTEPQARMYKTGDLGRWWSDGTIEYLGRNDHQVKIRGFRIELGEIEAQLAKHPLVSEAVVLAKEDVPGEPRLVAYFIPRDSHGREAIPGAEVLRAHLKMALPGHMIPSAFVALAQLPITTNGKVDRQALPAPGLADYVSREYEAPQGEVEEILAGIWQQLLRVDRVGRTDNFFELGGHSLLVVQLMDRLRSFGLSMEIRSAFESPTLADLARVVAAEVRGEVEVPPNRIPLGCEQITPQMLPLVDLEPEHIARITSTVPGGAPNIQDVYPLSPLQEGMLFHHLLEESGGDTYVQPMVLTVPSRGKLQELIAALQTVVDRYDILRTAILWEQLPKPVQVVYRHASLPVNEIALDGHRDVPEQLAEWAQPQRQRMDLRKAPLLRLETAADPAGDQWYVLLQLHHLACDHESIELLFEEVLAFLQGRAQELSTPTAYRNHVGQVLAYSRAHDAQSFFRRKLADIDEPTAPFGLSGLQVGAHAVEESHKECEPELVQRVRAQARLLGVSTATLCHAAFGLVVAGTSGRNDVVFGTVLLGRMLGSAGAQRIMGMFINTLPLRLRLHDYSARELVQQTQREVVELLGHEHASLAEAQRCSGIVRASPLFNALFNYRHSSSDFTVDWAQESGIKLQTGLDLTNYPITVSVDDLGERLIIEALTDRRINPHRLTGYVHTALQSLIRALEQAPETPARSLSILPEQERRQLLETFNATEARYPKDRLIHELFEEQARQTPDAVAVIHGDLQLTYAEVNSRADRLARDLLQRGVRADQLVGICIDRRAEMVIGLLGILKVGAGYLPLDPSYPTERLRYMLEDAAPPIVLTQELLRAGLPNTGAEFIYLDVDLNNTARNEQEIQGALELGITPESLIYVIYTSGSTGRPKGTAMTHRAMVNLIEWHRRVFGAGEGKKVLQFAALSFDVAFQEIFSTLCTGGTLVLVDEWVRRDAALLTQFLRTHSIERLFVPPLMLQSIADSSRTTGALPTSLRDVITAGEQLRISPEIKDFLGRIDRCRLHNHYGPTETHVVTALTLDGSPDLWPSLPSIGCPISNTQIYVLDEQHQPVPIGVAGEVFIGGAGLARGYRGRPDLTAQRFIENPLSADRSHRLYRTGDLGRWQMDGTVEFLGRNDEQVKIRGFRIELGEIESHLARHDQVKEAVVVAREDVSGEKRLVAYITRQDNSEPSAEDLRMHLKAVLPDHMIPSAFVALESLPLTPSGKLDRRALPAPDQGSYVSRGYEAPRGEIEEILAGIWQALLHLDRIGRRDNFFELGGHSLLIVQMMERLRQVGLPATVRSVYNSGTLADLASTLAARPIEQLEVPANGISPDCESIAPSMLPLVHLQTEHIALIEKSVPGGAANIQDIYPLAPLQEGILFHHLLDHQGGDPYVRPLLMSLSSREHLENLVSALQAVIDRHDILRTAMLWEQLPQPVQVVYRKATLPVQEIALTPSSKAMEQVKEWVRADRQRLDLREAPLLRLQVAADPQGQQWYALLRTHHLICDNQSLEMLFAELVECLQGRVHELAEPVPYRNHVAQALAHAHTQDAEVFFRSKLAEIDEPTAPFGLLDVRGDGSQIQDACVELEPALARRLRDQARRFGVSTATLFHATWALVVAHTSDRQDVVFGTVLLGRMQGGAGAQQTLGMFINTLPLRIRLQEVSAKELIQQTQRELVELLSHEQAPLAVAQRCSGIVGSAPLFSTLLNYRHSADDLSSEFARVAGATLLASPGATNYPILFSVDDHGERFTLEMETDRRADPQRILGYVSSAMRSLVDALEAAPQTPALMLSILPEPERHQVVELFNTRPPNLPQEKLVHEGFQEQVKRTPDAVAVVYEGHSLTYAELNSKANQLAWYLRDRGVGPDQLVGICVERSLEMVIGVLGILKAGGAYVPLDPAYPADRLAYMLTDAAPKVLLTQSWLTPRMPNSQAQVVALDADWTEIAHYNTQDPTWGPMASSQYQLMYVIYTSGSTGKPKGVMVEHRNVARLFAATEDWFGFNERDVWTLFHSFAFDFSVWELWGALLYGGRLIVVPHLTARSPQEFYRLLCAERVTVLNQTPSAFAQLIDAQEQNTSERHSLRLIIFGGEALEFRTLQPWIRRNGSEKPRLVNMYGITETTVHVTYRQLTGTEIETERGSVVGKPIPDLQVYLLDRRGQVAPIGVTAEIYVGGAGVARGYLNRPELTAERFINDPLSSDPRARMYKTGDLGRWRPDGTIEYLGRNDLQVKVRGFRIELGEIEAQLAKHRRVREAAVIAREDTPGDKRLVAYVVPDDGESPNEPLGVEELRLHLRAALPDYMVPSAFVVLDKLPLTANGKLDRRALPAPEFGAYLSREYQAPQGEAEEILAGIWQQLLQVERVGRRDNWFELGGHSLLIVQMMERLRRVGLTAEIRRVFENPTLADLAGVLTRGAINQFKAPPNRIPPGCTAITPQMLTLVELQQEHVDLIVKSAPGGAANIQDIYPLTPLQEGMLFHHLLDEQGGDTYVVSTLLSVTSRERLDGLITALQGVIDRHDILRTAVLWERLPRPLQVVYRQAHLPAVEFTLDESRDPLGQLKELLRSEHQRIDLRKAPLVRLHVAADPRSAQWYCILQLHHIVDDATSVKIVFSEITAHLEGRAEQLPAPAAYRQHVAQTLEYARTHDAEAYFRTRLADVQEPTTPFGLLDVHGVGTRICEATEEMDSQLARRVRSAARGVAVSAATLFHAAWALVVAHTSGRDDVVFGSVLLGRLQGSAGAQRILGLFLNTLPLRLQLQSTSVRGLVERTQRELLGLLVHEQASLATAQRCSGIVGSAPLFSSLLNYRHSAPDPQSEWSQDCGITLLDGHYQTNYPIMLSVDDLGDGFVLTAQTDQRVNPSRITNYLRNAIESLVGALEAAPRTEALSLPILPEYERRQVLQLFNTTQIDYPREKMVHELFEEQVRRTPSAVAVTHGGGSLTYAELNRQSNQLARYLRHRGVGPDQLVGICVHRSLEMVVGLLGIMKAGGAYVPLDPNYPPERLRYMLEDASPRVVLTQRRLKALLSVTRADIILLDKKLKAITRLADNDQPPSDLGSCPENAAYVIYTSGSTGLPKGTVMAHRSMVNLIEWHRKGFGTGEGRRVLQFAALSFDVAFQEIFSTLCGGDTLVLLDEWLRRDSRALTEFLNDERIDRLFVPPMMLQGLAEYADISGVSPQTLHDVVAAGERLRITPEILALFNKLNGCRLHNHYGPTESHVVTALTLGGDPSEWPAFPSIGRPIANTQIYVLNGQRQPVPVDVPGEIYIAGAGVACGYRGRPELTAQRFIDDPFRPDSGSRLYRTGDIGRWRDDGTLEYLGRNDDQVKLRGYRIELGEIEAQLARHLEVKDVAVIAREDIPGDKRLVAYIARRGENELNIEDVRAHLVGVLPEYMIPSAFVFLQALPLTPNGKLDRRALPVPEHGAYVNRPYHAPVGEIEAVLASICQDLLGVERVGRQDNFFELGGHSLHAMKLSARVAERLRVHLSVAAVFKYPTIEQLATELESQRRRKDNPPAMQEVELEEGAL